MNDVQLNPAVLKTIQYKLAKEICDQIYKFKVAYTDMAGTELCIGSAYKIKSGQWKEFGVYIPRKHRLSVRYAKINYCDKAGNLLMSQLMRNVEHGVMITIMAPTPSQFRWE